MPGRNQWALWLSPAIGVVIAAVSVAGSHGQDMAIVIFVTAVCVVWRVFEPIPIPVISLLPLAIFRLLGVLTPADVGEACGSY